MNGGDVRLRGELIDRLTQRWVIATGAPFTLRDAPWLDGPVGSPDGIGETWIADHAARTGANVRADPEAGLLPDMAALDGARFDARGLRPEVRDLYEHTARWEMDVWSRWSRWAEPGGRILNALFARRLRQLSLPLDPLEVAHGMESRVLALTVADRHIGTAWQREIRATGATVFGGFYGIADLPRAGGPSIRVVFPLPNGSVTVFLRPEVTASGSLRLVSPRGRFGEEGAYLVVRPDGRDRGWVRRVPLPEVFHVSVDGRGELRCDHRLDLGRAEVLRLHYRLRSAWVP